MIPNIYKWDYRYFIILPIVLIIISAFLVPGIEFGVDFKGGNLITLQLNQEFESSALENALLEEGYEANVKVFEVGGGDRAEIEIAQTDEIFEIDEVKNKFNSLIVEVSVLQAQYNTNASFKEEYEEKRDELYELADQMFVFAEMGNKADMYTNLNELKDDFGSSYLKVYEKHNSKIMGIIDEYADYSTMSIESVSPALSSHFLDQAWMVLIFSIILSTIFVFAFFRTFVPSLAVLLGAFSDIIMALGAMVLLGIPLTLPSFAALLMLIGYSLDTDILLTMRIIKRRGNPRENAWSALKTGMTMSFTAIVAFSVLLIVAYLTQISTYYEISIVALAGLFGDLIATWCLNAVIVLYYKERSIA